MVGGFRQGLNEAGFIEGQNVVIEFSSADGHLDRCRTHGRSHPPSGRCDRGQWLRGEGRQNGNQDHSDHFRLRGDPIREGLVTSINRPDGNVTGVTFLTSTIGAKRFELLHELMPRASVVAVLHDLCNPASSNELKDVEAAARALGRELVIMRPRTELRSMRRSRRLRRSGRGLCLWARIRFWLRTARKSSLWRSAMLSALYGLREFVAVGGLMSYASSQSDAYRQVGLYAGRVLQGAKPADLLVLQPTKIELVINLSAAKVLGLRVPQSLQVAADEVIE